GEWPSFWGGGGEAGKKVPPNRPRVRSGRLFLVAAGTGHARAGASLAHPWLCPCPPRPGRDVMTARFIFAHSPEHRLSGVVPVSNLDKNTSRSSATKDEIEAAIQTTSVLRVRRVDVGSCRPAI